MSILITGATGFVGSHLAEDLIKRGYNVRALVRPSTDISFLKKIGIEVVEGDLTDSSSLEKAVKDCEKIYHLAALTSRVRFTKNQFYRVNVEGTENLARAALRVGVKRFVYISTAGVYGTIENPPVDEKTEPAPNSLYRETKLLGEERVISYFQRERLPVTIARITSVIGPRSISWLGLFQSIAKGDFRIIGTGNNHSQLSYITDIVDGIRLCGEVEGIEGEKYLIAGKESAKLKDLISIIAGEIGANLSQELVPSAPFYAFSRFAQIIYKNFKYELPYSHRYEIFFSDNLFNISKAERELRYSPGISLKESIMHIVQWYRENRYI